MLSHPPRLTNFPGWGPENRRRRERPLGAGLQPQISRLPAHPHSPSSPTSTHQPATVTSSKPVNVCKDTRADDNWTGLKYECRLPRWMSRIGERARSRYLPPASRSFSPLLPIRPRPGTSQGPDRRFRFSANQRGMAQTKVSAIGSSLSCEATAC